MNCPNCRRWEIAEADVFCAWCRARLVDYSLSFNYDHVPVGDVMEDLVLTIRHCGSIGTIRIEKIESDQSWLSPQLDQIANRIVQVGRDIAVPFDVQTDLLDDDYYVARITVTSNRGARVMLFEATPRPKFKVMTDGEYTVLLDNIMDERMSGYLSVTRGIITVESLKTDVPWASVMPIQPDTLPCKLDQRGDNRLEFLFHIDEAYLLDQVEREKQSLPAQYEGFLIVKLLEFEEPRKERLRVNCFYPPRLKIPEEEAAGALKLPVFLGKRGELDLTLQNGGRDEPGRANLQIQEVKIDEPWLRPSGAIEYPISIGSGRFHRLTFWADTTEMNEGIHATRITFLTNIPDSELKQKDLHVQLEVRRMPDYEGALAIDFGTTNSCCAAVPDGFLTMIPIDETGNETTVSSAILYEDLIEDHLKNYRIGSEAYRVSFQPEYVSSAIRDVKRRLGTENRYDVTFLKNKAKRASYLPREVTADIIRRILERAEEYLGGRVTNCTVSHPSRFSLRQIDDLREALVACGIPRHNIKTVHESIGAALDYIQQKQVREKHKTYSLMVFDFGGGTTDVTLLRVKNDHVMERQLTVITPDVLGATGDAHLGGENVTEIVMDLILKQYEEVLRSRHADATIIIPVRREEFNDPYRQRLAVENRNFLRQWSEAAKIAISHFDDDWDRRKDAEPFIDGLPIRALLAEFKTLGQAAVGGVAVIINNQVYEPGSDEINAAPSEVIPTSAEINDRLRPRLEKISLMMKRLAQNNNISTPDIILISGKSSALPIVREVVTEYFPNSEIALPNDLKECVARGACQLSTRDPLAGVYLNIEDSQALSATTSRLGLRVNDTGRPIFHEVIDTGVPIEGDGLRRPVPGTALRRNSQIRIMENTSLEDEIMINGKPNPNITVLRVFSLDSKLTEWEKKNNQRITDSDLFEADIQLVVTPNLVVKLIANVPRMGEALEFEAELGGW